MFQKVRLGVVEGMVVKIPPPSTVTINYLKIIKSFAFDLRNIDVSSI